MYLTRLSLTNFRNFTRLDVQIPRGPVIITGANAQGKTSLLEAIYFLASFVSFQASNDRQLINFSEARQPLAVARVVGEYSANGASHRMEARIIQEPTGFNGSRVRKEILYDGAKQKMGDAIGYFNAVLFLPQLMGVIEGSPEERRRYLNLALAQVIPHYPQALANYTRALTQRNALLKALNETGGDASQLDFWDDQIASPGAQLIYSRIQAIQEMEILAARTHQELTRGGEVLRMCYDPAYDPAPLPPGQFSLGLDTPLDRSRIPLDEIRQGLLERLRKRRSEEIARGMTLTGPHRDDLRFLSNGLDLGVYGSRGQVRTAMLSAKLAEVSWVEARTGHSPVLLLDEVLAELDNNRRADLLSRLSSSQQALLTTTDLDLFHPEFSRQATIWEISEGLLKTF